MASWSSIRWGDVSDAAVLRKVQLEGFDFGESEDEVDDGLHLEILVAHIQLELHGRECLFPV